MVSRIGWPVDSPQVVDIELALHPGRDADDLRADVEAIVTSQLERVSQVRDELVAQRITVF
jgi:S-adenosylmethionine synthetase